MCGGGGGGGQEISECVGGGGGQEISECVGGWGGGGQEISECVGVGEDRGSVSVVRWGLCKKPRHESFVAFV